MCDLVVELKPEVVSFHFGLPDKKLAGSRQGYGREDPVLRDHGG